MAPAAWDPQYLVDGRGRQSGPTPRPEPVIASEAEALPVFILIATGEVLERGMAM